MKTKDICKLPINQLADTNCALLLWAIPCRLPDAIEVMGAWGFKYVSVGFTWVKLDSQGNPNVASLGNYTRNNSELCLLGRKGSIKQLRPNAKAISQSILAPRTRHSEKPHEVRERIVELFGDRPRIELFARHKVEGWDCWGNDPAIAEGENSAL